MWIKWNVCDLWPFINSSDTQWVVSIRTCSSAITVAERDEDENTPVLTSGTYTVRNTLPAARTCVCTLVRAQIFANWFRLNEGSATFVQTSHHWKIFLWQTLQTDSLRHRKQSVSSLNNINIYISVTLLSPHMARDHENLGHIIIKYRNKQ